MLSQRLVYRNHSNTSRSDLVWVIVLWFFVCKSGGPPAVSQNFLDILADTTGM
jgi:hypothetical protein